MRALLLLPLFAACADLPADEPEAIALTSYVRTTTDAAGHPRFSANGQPFRFVGGNITELPWLDRASQDQELAWAQSVGLKVVRVWGVDDATSASAMAAKLRTTLDLAAAHNIYITISLTHNYHQPNWVGGNINYHAVPGDARANQFQGNAKGFYDRPCSGLDCLGDDWIDWGYTAYYRDYATSLVRALADHPAIFSWDLANELASSGNTTYIVGRLKDFYVTMAGLVKGADPNHLVTTGMISTSQCAFNDAQRDAIYNSANIDYLTVHEYDGAGGNMLNQNAQNDEIWRANNRYHKAVVVEEVGVTSASALSTYYQNHFRPTDPSFAVTGIVYWGVGSGAHANVVDPVWFPAGLRASAQSTWQSWAASLAAENTQCVALAAGQSLGANQSHGSCDGQYSLVYQGDGNLVLYRNGGSAVWASCTNTGSVGGAFMQTDGNLVVYTSSGTAQWNSHTSGHSGARLLFEGGGLVLRDAGNTALWTSASWCH